MNEPEKDATRTPRGGKRDKSAAGKLSKDNPPAAGKVPETGGPAGLEPTRYGDWERNGRCVDF